MMNENCEFAFYLLTKDMNKIVKEYCEGYVIEDSYEDETKECLAFE